MRRRPAGRRGAAAAAAPDAASGVRAPDGSAASGASGGLVATTPGDREIRTERVFEAPRDRVWRAFTVGEQVARWWGRGNRLVLEQHEPVAGGRWRFVEHADNDVHGFEGRYREVMAPERIVQTFSWDGAPGHVSVVTVTMDELEGGRTRVVSTSLFHTEEERDGMLAGGMTRGLELSYAALERVLAEG